MRDGMRRANSCQETPQGCNNIERMTASPVKKLESAM